MENIDLKKYMTVTEARDAIGASQRAIWRILDRVGRDKCCITFLNRTLVRRDSLDLLKAHYYPYYSEAHQAMVKTWGSEGGNQKAKNAKNAKNAKKAKRATARRAGRVRAS